MSYTHELTIAHLAARRATLLTQSVFPSISKGTLSKSDSSPVTIGDFGAQALINSALLHNFPNDTLVGEEDASSLRSDPQLAGQVWELVQKACAEDREHDAEIGSVGSQAGMLDALDAGKGEGGAKGRIWTIDPIDGTKGFLRGGQYAVCVALIVDGDVKVGVLGCPNLPVDTALSISSPESVTTLSADDNIDRGLIFTAQKGSGAYMSAIQSPSTSPNPPTSKQQQHPITMRPLPSPSRATFCESVESAHSSHSTQALIASTLGITLPPLRMDSQAKYASIARGAGDIYLRLPVRKDYEEKIWDHAAGDLVVREAGGEVTDVRGRRLDFGRGRTLRGNVGVVAARREVHGRVLEGVREVLESGEKVDG